MSSESKIAPQGVNYLVDGKGQRTAIVIDFADHEELIEEVVDVLISKERLAEEDRISFAVLKQEISMLK
jgi:hypothetical protein